MEKNCHGKQTASLFSVYYKYMLLLFMSDFCIWQSLIFKQKLLQTAHKQLIIWQTCRKVEGAAGREEEVSQAMEQIAPTSLKMARDPNATMHMVTVLLFGAGVESDAQMLRAGTEQCFTTSSSSPPSAVCSGWEPGSFTYLQEVPSGLVLEKFILGLC